MVHVHRTFVVDKPSKVTADYLVDFAHATEWDPGTVACARVDSGPVRPGAKWRNTSRVLGRETELVYELVAMREDHVKFVGRNKTATSVDDIRLRPLGDRTEVRYTADITFHGAAKLASPVMRLYFERLGNKVVTSMQAAVDRL